jgi:ribose transport system ATP-binding protein
MNDSKILEVKKIYKKFPGVEALKGVDLEVFPNEIVSIVGENGAGKSVLMKILVGIYQPERGHIYIRNKEAKLDNIKHAAKMGIGMVFQEQSLLNNLTVTENIFLGHEESYSKGIFIKKEEMYKKTKNLLQKIGVKIDPDIIIKDLTLGQRQMVEIVRILWLGEKCKFMPIIILDEPTTMLNKEEIINFFSILRNLKKKASIIFISHRLEEILEISDRIYILKDGENVKNFITKQATIGEIQELMIGKKISKRFYHEEEMLKPKEDVILKIENFTKKGKFRNISFELHKCEIISICGIFGSGKEVLIRSIAGIEKVDSGKLFLNNKQILIDSPKKAIKFGIGYIPIDRREEGLILNLSIANNITLPNFTEYSPKILINLRKEKDVSNQWIKKLKIKASSIETICLNLSGGNQQKTIIAKWIATNIKILIMDHPTRGIDIGGKEEIYDLIRMLSKNGLAILLLSDTLEEDIALSNNIIIMKEGIIVDKYSCMNKNKPSPLEILQKMQ